MCNDEKKFLDERNRSASCNGTRWVGRELFLHSRRPGGFLPVGAHLWHTGRVSLYGVCHSSQMGIVSYGRDAGILCGHWRIVWELDRSRIIFPGGVLHHRISGKQAHKYFKTIER